MDYVPPIKFNKGINRQVASLKADAESLYDLINLRQSPVEVGKLEQTPYFNAIARTARDYWNGSASVTESATTEVRGILERSNNIILTTQTAATASASIQVFYQTTEPATVSLYTHCLLTINVANPGVNLGATYDVEIDGAGTFKWQKNGGGYTALVPCTITGTAIDGGNATVYFLATTGFTVTDAWSWTRTDRMLDASPAADLGAPTQGYAYGTNYYFLNSCGRIMVYNGYAIRSVGYRKIFGRSLHIYEGHLFVLNQASTAPTNPAATPSEILVCSDLNDFDNFYPTDVNEADIFTFSEIRPITSAKSTIVNLMGAATINNLLFIFTGAKVFYTQYLGLPLVFSFQEHSSFPLTAYKLSAIRVYQTEGGCYILREDGPWFFNGETYNHVGAALGLPLVIGTYNYIEETVGCYSFQTKEFFFFPRNRNVAGSAVRKVYVYQEKYGTWYSRNVNFPLAAKGVATINSISGSELVVFAASLTYYEEDVMSSGVPVTDNGGAFTIPSLTTQIFSNGSLFTVKEISSAWLVANVNSLQESSSTYYSLTNDIAIDLKWVLCDKGVMGATTSSNASSVWIPAANNLVSFPRVAFRGIAFTLQIRGTSGSKPPAGVELLQLEPLIMNDKATR